MLSDTPQRTGEYLGLREAQEAGVAVVRELGGGAGGGGAQPAQVNQLVIENRGQDPIFVPGGTVVKGGKQDRQIARDLIIAAGQTVPVDAFCVEQGRWTTVREGEATEGQFQSMDVLASKRIRASGQYAADQRAVWSQVSTVNSKAGNAPATSTFLATIEDSDEEALERRSALERRVREHLEGLGPEDPLVGFAYSINGEPIAVRVFANPKVLASQLDAFLRTMCMEAEVAWRRADSMGREPRCAPASAEPLMAMVRGIDQAAEEAVPAADGSRNRTRTNGWGGHSTCQVQVGGEWVTLSEDWTAAAEFEAEARAQLEALGALGYTDG